MTELKTVVEYLKNNDGYLILMHASPDGDTIGTACGLCRILHRLGKRAAVACADEIPAMFLPLTAGLTEQNFDVQSVIAADVADIKLLGGLESWAGRIDVCIDHHMSNTGYAPITYVDAASAAASEIVADILTMLGMEPDRDIAECIYTGISTDTGCFKFSNTTARSHIITAKMLETGIDIGEINRRLFEAKTRAAASLERLVYDTLEYYAGGKIAVITVRRSAMLSTGACENDLNGIASLPRQIDGVLVGITLKETEEGVYKVSVRTHAPADASEICKAFGGGGHIRASGCRVRGAEQEVKSALVKRAEEILG